MTEQTEPGAGLLFAALIGDVLSILLPDKKVAREPTARQQELRDIIEDITLHSRNGRSYHKGLHMALDDRYSAREVDRAIQVLKRRRILNELHEGPDDTAYSHNNKAKTFFAGLTYL